MMKELGDEKDTKQEQKTVPVFSVGEIIPDLVIGGIEAISEVSTPVVNFLIANFSLATNTALEVASKLPQSIKEQIEKIEDVDLQGISS